jgi:hypothetical protein
MTLALPRRAALFTLALAALAAAAADTRESRPVGDFTEVGLSAPVDVHVALGEAPSLTLEGDAEHLARIETVVENGRLKIRTRTGHSNWNWDRKITARVTARRIDGLAIAGSGDITAPSIRGEALKVSIAGSGDIRVGGKVEGLTASIAGSGDIRASELDAQKVKVTIAGSGDATVRASQSLTVNVSGSGDVRYYGEPTVEKSIMGSGSVRRAKDASS